MKSFAPVSPRSFRLQQEPGPAVLIFFGTFSYPYDFPVAIFIDSKRNQYRHVLHFAAPAAFEPDPVKVDVRVIAREFSCSPLIYARVYLLIEVADRLRAHPSSPKCLRYILNTLYRYAGYVHFYKRFLNRRFAAPVALYYYSLERINLIRTEKIIKTWKGGNSHVKYEKNRANSPL